MEIVFLFYIFKRFVANFALQNNGTWQLQIAASFRNSYVSLIVRTHFLVVDHCPGLKFANYNILILFKK